MTTNKERGYYTAVYTCINCGYKMEVQVPYGKSMFIFVYEMPKSFRDGVDYGYRISPECEYCGRSRWSHGKRPE